LTAAATSSTSFLLDLYPGANAAYSLRKLRAAYTGAAIRVVNSNTSAELDIGFTVNGDFDSVALATFCGADTGLIRTWYDQSGNSFNASVTIPAISIIVYELGVPITYNSKPSIKGNGTGKLIASSATGNGNGIRYISSYSVFNLTALNTVNYLAYENGTSFGIYAGGTFASTTGFGIAFVQTTNEITNNILKLGVAKANTIPYAFVNNSTPVTEPTGGLISFMNLFGGDITSQSHIGGISELIFYNSDQTANNTGINNNINAYYTIY